MLYKGNVQSTPSRSIKWDAAAPCVFTLIHVWGEPADLYDLHSVRARGYAIN